MGTQSIIQKHSNSAVRILAVFAGTATTLLLSAAIIYGLHRTDMIAESQSTDANLVLFLDLLLVAVPLMGYGFIVAPLIWNGTFGNTVLRILNGIAKCVALFVSLIGTLAVAGGAAYVCSSLQSEGSGQSSGSNGMVLLYILSFALPLLIYGFLVAPWLWRMTYVETSEGATLRNEQGDSERGVVLYQQPSQEPYGAMTLQRRGNSRFIMTPVVEGMGLQLSALEEFERRHGLQPSGNRQLDEGREQTIRLLSAPTAKYDALGNEIESDRPTLTDGFLSPFYTGPGPAKKVEAHRPVVVGKVKEVPPERPTVAGGFKAAQIFPPQNLALVRLQDIVPFPLPSGQYEHRKLLMRTVADDGTVVEVFSGVYLDDDELEALVDSGWQQTA